MNRAGLHAPGDGRSDAHRQAPDAAARLIEPGAEVGSSQMMRGRPRYGGLTPAEAAERRRTCQCCGESYRTAIHKHLCPTLRDMRDDLNAALREIREADRAARPLAPETLRRNRYRKAAA